MPGGPGKPVWMRNGKMTASLSICGVRVEGCWRSAVEAASEGSGNVALTLEGSNKKPKEGCVAGSWYW